MKNIAIIGASYLQLPLIQKAKAMGYTTHVFAWAAGDVGETAADYFYPISIVEKEAILEQCREIGICGICTIASDLAAITVNYVANALGLIGNSPDCALVSTNKNLMRRRFEACGDPSPKSIRVTSAEELRDAALTYPVIVKPLDRSGSRGITKLESPEGLAQAIQQAKEQGFEKAALVEEFAEGQEYSVEYLSWEGQHHFLALTHKYTTGAPSFIETGHLEPAPASPEIQEKIKAIVSHALNSLGIRYGASHSELKVAPDGSVKLIEIGGRMGGDFIGSSLVELSTGIDFVGNVIRIAVGQPPVLTRKDGSSAAVRFIFNEKDVKAFHRLQTEHPEYLVNWEISPITQEKVTDSSNRFGYFILSAESDSLLLPYLPEKDGET